MFSDSLISAVLTAANEHGIEPAALLAIVEVETDGAVFEQDGYTPQFLYERHIAYREAAKYGVRPQFVAAGLAIPQWSRSTQYKDQGTSARRLDLMRRACAIHEETALRSASWGIGQTMGFLAEELGFANAREMVAHMRGSLSGQMDCMIREISRKGLIAQLNGHNWARVAYVYNGAGYRANAYDTRMAAAHSRWVRKLEHIAPGGVMRPPPPEQSLSREQVRQVQERLRGLGYYEVGEADGLWGSRTSGAISAFQSHEGLTVTGHYDDATRDALMAADPRPVSAARADTSSADLREAGSRTVIEAEKLTTFGRLTKWAGIGGAGTWGFDQMGWLQWMHGREELAGILSLGGRALDWLGRHWWVVALGVGVFVLWRVDAIVRARVEDHQTGRHSGV